ncbi:MAG: hypothetical protein ACU836_15870 [Gammaproteobacteria bacterium]
MENIDEALKNLANEFAAIPSPESCRNPITLANFCDELEKGVLAVDAIATHMEEVDDGQTAALAIVTQRLLFNVRALQLLLFQQARRA